jgi:transcriptional regulator with XRE-family HTH domain
VLEEIFVRLGARIRKLRKQKGWRQIDLAQHSGIHEVHLSHLERGNREIGFLHLAALAKAFDITMSVMLEGIDEQESKAASQVS